MLSALRTCSWSRYSVLKRTRFQIQTAIVNVQRPVTTSLVSSAKIFFDSENSHSHNVFLKSSNYKLCPTISCAWDETFSSEESVSSILIAPPPSTNDMVVGFANIVGHCQKSGCEIAADKFDKFIDCFTLICDQFTDEQMLTCLNLLQLLPSPPGVNSRNFYELWKSLDDVCVLRLENWSANKIILVMDYWYCIHLAKCSDFVREGIKKISRKSRKLSPHQLVQVMFACNLVRRPFADMFDLEMRFDEVFDSLNIDEVGVMCTGFFKTQTKLHKPELITKIYKRLINNLEVVDDITLVNYIKTLRYSSKLPQADLMYELLEKICPQINRISLLACLHIALAGCDIQMCHARCIELILERFNREICETRIKDMERICHVMGLFNIKTESGIHHELCENILSKLHDRIDEIIHHPKCFQACLHYLTLCGHHNEDMINAALSPKFIKHTFGKNYLLSREVFCLNSFAKINLKESYKGDFLLEKQLRTMGKLFTHYIPEKDSKFKLNVTDRILVEVTETCRHLWGASSIKHVLPHFERPDVVITYDRIAKKGVHLSKLCPEDYSGKILQLENITESNATALETVVVVVGGWNNYVRNTNTPTGLLAMKILQLRIVGYKVALIPWYEWREQETSVDRQKYILRKVSSLLELKQAVN